MREEIRLGNEALAQQDLETARRYFQQVLLMTEATEIQKRIAANRLRDIQEQETQAAKAADPQPARPRTSRRKTAATKASSDEPTRRFVRSPDRPVVVIRKY